MIEPIHRVLGLRLSVRKTCTMPREDTVIGRVSIPG